MQKQPRTFIREPNSRLGSSLITSIFVLALGITGCDPSGDPPAESTEKESGAESKPDPSKEDPGSNADSQEPEKNSGSETSNEDSQKESPDHSTEDGDADNPGETPEESEKSQSSNNDKPSEKESESDNSESNDSGEDGPGSDDSEEKEPGEDDPDSEEDPGKESGEDNNDSEDPKTIDCKKLVASGVDKGQVLPELLGTDESGQAFSLHSLCNKAVMLEVSTGWCGPCNQVAPHLQGLYEKYKERGFEVVTVLAEGFRNGTTTTQADLKRWKTKHKLTHKVVAPSNIAARAILKKYWNDSRGFPSSKLMAPGMVIFDAKAHSEKDAKIESALPK